MKHSRLFSMCLTLLAIQSVWAGPRSYRQAAAIAEKQAAKLGITITPQVRVRAFSDVSLATVKTVASASSPSSASDGETASYYVFPYGEDKGFAIVSGDDQMPEIVAYADKGTLDVDNMSEGCREFLLAYKQMAEAVASGDKEARNLVAQKQGFMAATEVNHPTVKPLLGEIQWNQQAPYNNLCPYNESKQKRCYTGCVATAMAQVFNFWKHPKELKEDIPGYESTKFGIWETYEIPKISKGYVYDWDNMLPQYSEGNYTEAQGAAVANLMYHCGAAFRMTYSTAASDANYGIKGDNSGYDITPYSKYFGYDPDLVCLVFRNSYTLSEWCKMIDTELEAGRPMLYCGSMGNGKMGHAFVCDGADGNGLYHINWGWSGANNGYFDITILKYSNLGVAPGFNSEVGMVIGLVPDNGVKDEPLVHDPPYLVSVSDPNVEITAANRTSVSEPFTLVYETSLRYCKPQPQEPGDDDDGDDDGDDNDDELSAMSLEDYEEFLYCVGLRDASGNYVPLCEPAIGYMGTFSLDHKFTIKYAFPVGVTAIYAIYSEDMGKTWYPCRYKMLDNVMKVSATETTLSMAEDNTDFKATLQPQGDWIVGQNCHFSYTMTNQNPYDYAGNVDIYYSRTPTMPEKPRIEDYVDIAPGGTTTHRFSFTPREAADYYFWIYDFKHDQMMVNAQKITVSPDPATGILSASGACASQDGLLVTAGKGTLSILATKAQTVNIYNVAGQIVRSLVVKTGSVASVNLPGGVYVIGKKKVMVKVK